MRPTISVPRVASAVSVLVLAAAAAGAQLPSASPSAFAMAGNYTARARGYEAVAWNAANLAMPGRPFISFGTVIFGGTFGLDPIDIKTLHSFGDSIVDSLTRAGWVQQVRASGRQRTRIDGGITPFAMSVGPFGLQVGASTYINLDMSPDIFEALMFGNAGNNGGQPMNIDPTGTGIASAAITAGALSFALPVPFRFTGGILPNEHFALALTGKYVLGNALLIANDGGSTFGTNVTQIRFPTISPPDSGFNGQLGTGTGADLSAAWSAGPWRVGIRLENIFNSFKWDTTKLTYRTGDRYISQDSTSNDTTVYPFSAAPQALQDRVLNNVFKPAFNAGVSFQPVGFLTITADVHQQTGDDNTIMLGPKNRMGVGAELRILPFIPLRAGIASVTDGWQAGAGFGLRLLGYELGVSGSLRRRGAANESGLMIGLVGIGH